MKIVDNISKSGRIIYIDYAKILVTFLVVYGHLISIDAIERNYIYAFHMPFFFFVSGMLHKSKLKLIDGILDAFLKLFVPALFFMFIYRIYQFGWNFIYEGFDLVDSAKILLSDIRLSVQSIIFGHHKDMGNGVCWFLFALFWQKILTLLWDNNKIYFSIVIFLLLCIVVMRCNVIFVGQALRNFPFYMVGYFFVKKINALIEKFNRHIWIVGFCFLLISGIMTYLNGRVSFLSLSMVGKLSFPINIIVCYSNAFIASLGMLFVCSICKKEFVWSKQMAMSLISIVGLQQIFFVSSIKITGESQIILLNVLVAIIIMIICFLFHKILSRYIPWSVGIKK